MVENWALKLGYSLIFSYFFFVCQDIVCRLFEATGAQTGGRNAKPKSTSARRMQRVQYLVWEMDRRTMEGAQGTGGFSDSLLGSEGCRQNKRRDKVPINGCSAPKVQYFKKAIHAYLFQ
jgi:hypothetical protein